MITHFSRHLYWWAKLPDWLVIGLYTLCRPVMHRGRQAGYCRMPDLCMTHSYVISKRENPKLNRAGK